MIQKKIVTMFGIPMHAWTMKESVRLIKNRLLERKFTSHSVVNVAKLVNMQTDTELSKSVTTCDIVNIDGAGLVIAGRLMGKQIPERVAGIDLFYKLLAMAEAENISVYLLGAKQNVITRTVQQLQHDYPDIDIAGFHHGYFSDYEQRVVGDIARSGANMLFVAISSPKKEIFINRWKSVLNVQFVMGVGGTFDVVAGKVKRAPTFMQNLGLEWLYRIIQEPGRMWKRYLVTTSKFICMFIHNIFSNRYTGKKR